MTARTQTRSGVPTSGKARDARPLPARSRVRRPSWVLVTRSESDIDQAFDLASYRCKRCTRNGLPSWALGPPAAISREAADHILAHHAGDLPAVEWARATLSEVLR